VAKVDHGSSPVKASGGDGERLRTVAGTLLGWALTGSWLLGMQPGGSAFGLSGSVEDRTLIILEDGK